MNEPLRAEWFLSRVHLHPPPQIPSLVKPQAQDSTSLLPGNHEEARLLLVQQRVADPDYISLEKQERRSFRTRIQKEAVYSRDIWDFTNHEVAKVLDTLLSANQLPPVGVAHSLLSHSTLASLDELWCHLQDPHLDNKRKGFSRHSTSSQPASSPQYQMTWLDKATSHLNMDYIHLLCQIGISQEVLTRAFGVALSAYSMDAMKLLLSFGAVASSYQQLIKDYISHGRFDLLELLLSAPNSMSTAAWVECLNHQTTTWEPNPGPKQSIPSNIFLMCAANRPDLVCESLFLASLESQNLETTAILLAYAVSTGGFMFSEKTGIIERACALASHVRDNDHRLAFFIMLDKARLMGDNPTLREELVRNVKARHLPLIKILVDAGVAIDTPEHHALYWASSQLDFEVLDLLKSGTFLYPVSLALNYVPDSTSELAMMRFISTLGPFPTTDGLLDPHLFRAVRNKQYGLARILLDQGASVEFEQGASIQAALVAADMGMLELLLQYPCSPEILSAKVPIAMMIFPRSSRLLMKTRHPIDIEELSKAFFESVSGQIDDLKIAKMLLKKYRTLAGAMADDSANGKTMALLSKTLTAGGDDETANLAFNHVSKNISLNAGVRLNLLTLLLHYNISQASLHDAFAVEVQAGVPNVSIIRLLLANTYHADQDKAARFTLACTKGPEAMLQSLRRHVGLRAVLSTILSSMPEESDIARAFRICIKKQPGGFTIKMDELLFECILKFPEGTELLDILLDYGVSAAANIDLRLFEGWDSEPCTALIWCLHSQPRVHNNVILHLLNRGQDGMYYFSMVLLGR